MKKQTILIVEDEILIAELLARYLRKQGFGVAGIASNYGEAKQLYYEHEPDLLLLDVRLRGPENGIDFARFLRSQKAPPPFIFVTSQSDVATIDAVADTLPAGYLTKPVRPTELHAAVSVALRRRRREEVAATLTVTDGDREIAVALDKILYLESEHVYVHVHTKDGHTYLLRTSLAALMKKLPAQDFFRVHRGYAINRNWVEDWNDQFIQMGGKYVPVSRSRRREVDAWLSVV